MAAPASKGKKEVKKKKSISQSSYYKVDGGKVTRNRKFCPKCGQGFFMAEHKNRVMCGKCQYTEFKKKE